MYQLEFLPIAKQDIDSIIDYISNHLKNKTAALNLSKCFIENANNILIFPYSFPCYRTTSTLRKNYRSIKVKNYLMFYTINEKDKIITIARVLYQKMDINSRLN